MAATALPGSAQFLPHPRTAEHTIVLGMQRTHAAHQPGVLLRHLLRARRAFGHGGHLGACLAFGQLGLGMAALAGLALVGLPRRLCAALMLLVTFNDLASFGLFRGLSGLIGGAG